MSRRNRTPQMADRGRTAPLISRVFRRECRGTPDSPVYDLIFLIARAWMGRRHRVTVEDDLLRQAEAPYLLLANHESFFDFYYLALLNHPKRPDFLVNEYYCTRPVLKGMARGAGILSKKLFTKEMTSAMGIMRTVRKGYPVVIFPEGRLSPDGRSNPIAEPGGAFYKRLKVDLVLTKIRGAYFADPKWRKKSCPSEIRVTVERIIRREELEALSAEELDRIVASTLYNDASADDWNLYPQPDKAEGLENLLYRCPDCGALYATAGRGNDLICSACGAVRTLDEHYRFTDGATIGDCYDAIRALEEPGLEDLVLEAEVETKIFGAGGSPARTERGVCALDKNGFRYRSDSEEFTIPPERLPALAYSCGEEFELYHEGELHYFYPAENRQQCARWGLIADMLAARRRK